MEAKALTVVTPRHVPLGRDAAAQDHHAEPREAHVHRLQARPRGLLPQEARAARASRRSTSAWSPPTPSGRPRCPGYAKYKPIETTYELKKLEVPGVYVVKVTDEKTLQATTLVLGSDLDAIVKTSREQVLVFAQDMKTGKGRAGARVLVADGDGRDPRRRRPGDDGVLLRRAVGQAARGRPRRRPSPAPRGIYLVLDGADVAGSGLGVPEQGRAGAHRRGPTSTPTGRPTGPGQTVALRGVVREVADGQYANVPGRDLPARGLPTAGAGSSSPGR